jgi:LmbE family N-acetylglucosaminyl deacetylase
LKVKPDANRRENRLRKIWSGGSMREKLVFEKNDRIAVIAPHPDDECLGAAAALILASERTDIYVITDGSHGNPKMSIAEEAKIRRLQFEAEMEAVNPRSWEWIGIEDTTLPNKDDDAISIDFTPYTKIFLPWHQSPHPDHRAAALMCCRAIRRQHAQAECFMYEIITPFYRPTHCVDITEFVEEKRRLIRFHKDQGEQEEMNLTVNRLRGAQMLLDPNCRYAECYLKVDAIKLGYNPDLIIKLYTLREDLTLEASLAKKGIRAKRVMPPDFTPVYEFIRDNFARSWADEALAAMMRGACFVAVRDGQILSFLCVGAIAPDYAGPGGTIPEVRGLGINTLLNQKAFRYLIDQGFQYAIAGSVAPAERRILEKIADVVVVEDSEDSYANLLRR